MKKSHLTLAILTAVLVSACGGSSSNDDATQDHGKPITPSKTTPTKTTPTTPTTNDNSAKKPSTPTASTPSDSTPTTPITPKTPTETTPPKTTPITPAKTLEQAKADLEKAKNEFQTALSKENDLDKTAQDVEKEHDKAFAALIELLKKQGNNKPSAEEIAKAKLKVVNTELDLDNANVNANKALKEVLSAKKAMAENELIIAQKDNRDTVKAEKELVKAKFSLAQANGFLVASQADAAAAESTQKQLKVKILEEKYDAQVDTLANATNQTNSKTLANNYKAAKKELGEVAMNSEGDPDKVAAARKKLNDAKTALENGSTELKDLSKELTEARTKAKEAETKKEESQKAAEEAQNPTPEEKATHEEVLLLSLYNGVRFSDAQNDTFGEVRKVSYNEGTKQWSIVFKDKTDEPLTVSVQANKPYGTFTAAKEGNPAQGVKATAYSAYGFVGDKFFSVGKLKNLSAMSTGDEQTASNQPLKYEGTAFVNATVKGKETPQVAVFNAEANLGAKTLNGSFSHFTDYTADNFNNLTLPEKEAAESEKVKFTSTINPEDSSFKSADDAKVKVQGFFYQATEDKSRVGGLVDSKKEGHVFKGAFGGVEQPQEKTQSQEKNKSTEATQGGEKK